MNTQYPFDVSKMFKQFNLPGIDLDAILESQRKNLEAVNRANQVAIEGTQDVINRQLEVVRKNIESINTMINQVMQSSSPEERLKKQAELTKLGIEQALSDMRELAEMIVSSNNQAVQVLSDRMTENLKEIKVYVDKASNQAGE